ncbi:MAG: acyl-CoA thioesterase [Kiritimatiellae bacterium]|nr:acyl-CoA thioesterase [Kiritimatiellia bacterium]
MHLHTPLVVRSYECDSYGHVNNANYVHYLEYARGEYMKAVHFDYPRLIAEGYFTVITRIDISYRASAKADDELVIETYPLASRHIAGTFRQIIRRGDVLIADAQVSWCMADHDGHPVRPPAWVDLSPFAPE